MNDYMPLSIPEYDARFLNSTNDINAIASAFGIQKAYLRDYERITFSNAAIEDWAFKKLIPKVEVLYFKRVARKEKKRMKKTGVFFGKIYIRLEK